MHVIGTILNIYTPSEAECEEKLADLMAEIKRSWSRLGLRKKRAENRTPPSGKVLPEGGDFSCLWLLCGQR